MKAKRAWRTPLSSLLVTVTDEECVTAAFRAVLEKMEGVTVGEPVGRYLPLTIEDADARPLHEWLESLPTVVQVDVTFCSVSPESSYEAV